MKFAFFVLAALSTQLSSAAMACDDNVIAENIESQLVGVLRKVSVQSLITLA